MREISCGLRPLTFVILFAFTLAGSYTYGAQMPDPHSVPSVNGGIGPCTVEFTVKDASGAPIYNAKVHVHISYGFLGVHKMDLEVGTNVDGKARVSGLPKKVKIPLYFQAKQDSKEADTSWDPATSCQAEQSLTLK